MEQIQVPSTTSEATKTSRETQALLQHSWRPGEIPERLLLPHCPTAAHPWAARAVRGCGREEDRATQWNILCQWARGKENSTFPSTGNMKHIILSAPHLLYTYLFIGKKMCEAALQVKDDTILLHSMEKQTGYAGFRSWALLLKFNRSSPGWRRGWWGEIKVQKLNFSCCPWPSSLHLQHLLVWY